MRTGQVWSDRSETQEETTPRELEAAETAEVADSRPEGTPTTESVPPVSWPALFRSVSEGERGKGLPVTTAVLRLAREAALFDTLHWPELPDSPTVAGVDSADKSEDDQVYQWQPGLVLSLVMLGGLVTNRKDRPRTRLFSSPNTP